ncbi:type VI secretion system needle protein Hcp, partial [Tenacibaculum finnmarkense genomovar ulcerans]
MGSFRASLELGGKEFDVLQTEYVFSRDTDKKGKIASNVYGGRINITIESTADTSVIEAMLNSQFKAIEGKV